MALNELTVSVITVCYNSAETLERTLQSVVDQAYPKIEHIIIDGASTDGTAAILDRFRPHLKHVVSEPDQGIYDAMNKGLRLAAGDVIGFLNADDFYTDENVIARVANAFVDANVEACFGDLVYVTADNEKVVRYWKSRPYKKGSFACGWCPAHPTFYVRRSALERLGAFDLTYHLAADVEFMMRYVGRGNVQSVYIPHVQIRMSVGGVTNQSWQNIARQNREIFHALRKNAIPYSPGLFFAHKLINRLWQRLRGLLYNISQNSR